DRLRRHEALVGIEAGAEHAEEERQPVRGEDVRVEERRPRRVDVRRDDDARAGGRSGAGCGGEDQDREGPTHLWRGYGRARTADAHHGGMGEVGFESVLLTEPAGKRLEQRHGDLELGAAGTADEVAVAALVREMPARHAVLEVRV